MLPVTIKLDGIFISFMVSVFHSCLKAACKAQIHRKIQQVETVFPANGCCPVSGAVIDHNIIKLRILILQLPYHILDIRFLIIGGNHDQHLVHFDFSPHFSMISQISSTVSRERSGYNGSVSTSEAIRFATGVSSEEN